MNSKPHNSEDTKPTSLQNYLYPEKLEMCPSLVGISSPHSVSFFLPFSISLCSHIFLLLFPLECQKRPPGIP